MNSRADHVGLRACAVEQARRIVAAGEPPPDTSETERAVYESAARTLRLPGEGYPPRSGSAAVEALTTIADCYTSGRLRTGITGEMLYRAEAPPGTWARLMIDPPMGEYAELVAGHLLRLPLAGLRVLELGAGVGNLTKRCASRAAFWLATDAHAFRGTHRVDFDDAEALAVLGSFDVVCAVNALHCALDPAATVAALAGRLAPGGMLILGEGAPGTRDVPWYLDLAFAPMRGWHDRGGFRPVAYWARAMVDAGLIGVGHERLVADGFALGGAVWARRPTV